MTRSRKLALIPAAAVLMLLCASAAVVAQESTKPITEKGLMGALTIGGLKSKELAEIIDRRGVDFALTKELEQQLRDAGATPEVIEAVRTHYHPPEGMVSVPAPAGGYLSFDVKPNGAAVTVTGPASFAGGPSETACPAGQYNVTVSFDGYLPQSRTVVVASGEHHHESFELAMDRAALTGKLSEAKSKMADADYAAAISASDTVLSQDPENGDALVVLAEAAFATGDMNRFVVAGTKAIHSGKSITIQVQHAHLLWGYRIHPVNLTISHAGIAVVSDPPDARCKLPEPLGFDLISSAQVIRDQRGFLDLRLQYSSKPGGRNPKNLDFVPEDSQFGRRAMQPGQIFSPTTLAISEPANGPAILEGILKLVERARQ